MRIVLVVSAVLTAACVCVEESPPGGTRYLVTPAFGRTVEMVDVQQNSAGCVYSAGKYPEVVCGSFTVERIK